MKIHRSRPGAGFTRVPNGAVRDVRLSWKARGILAYLLSHVDEGWTIDADGLAIMGPDGRAAVLAGLKELVAAGYIVRTKRRGERGQWVTEVELWDTPQVGSNGAAPTVDSPTSGNQQSAGAETAGRADSRFSDVGSPDVGQPDVGKPHAVVPEDQEEDQEEDHPEDHEDLGGTLPPNPLRPEPPSESRTDQENSFQARQDQPQGQVGNHRPRTRAIGVARVHVDTRCDHGFTIGLRGDGLPTCTLCRRQAVIGAPTGVYNVIQFPGTAS